MTDVMCKILENSELSNELIQKGLINRSKYSWQKTAFQTLECYNLFNTKI